MSRDRNLNHLHPYVLQKWLDTDDDLKRHGLQMMVYETWRDEAQQARDYAVGRDALGRVVGPVLTNAPPGSSFHGITYPNGQPCSFALHAAIIRPGGLLGLGDEEYVGSKPDLASLKMMEAVALVAQRRGFRSGMNWDRDDNLRENGEWDLHHLEFVPAGLTLAKIVAAINTQGDVHELLGRLA